eukprot:Gregarina_sp_Poly_1__6976@NODE_379_length_9079_cov_111_368842_g312_i0_p4_GENE_NODE_379_length_9079_cov_111_368842_g312_i0NODE_379_length_9079_cov_111_368842_g312_i0_p4_ORF_typecomplete_len405_score49_58SH3_2/PF07653_17/4_3e05ProkRING_4/PF14447_6/0_0023SH3_9/PF14604_6/0_0054SH3_1/PF00018_28/0_0058OSTHTH/PF12872_7/0_038zfC3HC4/PF00097_25/0_2zfRING_5/PF14634_6/2_1Zn_ribbon_17/PF17120_5/3_NODE_379_length_9079_cov_111_368842_g312_i044345648
MATVSADNVDKMYELLIMFPELRDSEIRPRWRERFGEDLDYEKQGFKTIQQWMKKIPKVDVKVNAGVLWICQTKATPKPRKKRIVQLVPELTLDQKAENLKCMSWNINKTAFRWTQRPLPCCVGCSNVPFNGQFIVLKCKHLMCEPCYTKRVAYFSTCSSDCRHRMEQVAIVPQEVRSRGLYLHLFSMLTQCAQSNCKIIDTFDAMAAHIKSCIIMRGRRSLVPMDKHPTFTQDELHTRGVQWEKTYHQLLEELCASAGSIGSKSTDTTGMMSAIGNSIVKPYISPSIKDIHFRDSVKVESSWDVSQIVPEAEINSTKFDSMTWSRPLNYEENVSKLMSVQKGEMIDIIGHPANSVYGWCLGQSRERSPFRIGWFPTKCILSLSQDLSTTIRYYEAIKWRSDEA